MTASNRGRRTKRFTRLRANLRAQHLPCWICGQPIDYTLAWPHPEAFEPDHYHPLSTHPHLAEDPANLRASHARCNKNRGVKDVKPSLGVTSRDW